eukprot:9233918-Alexandrium_andersonii.AAC.1
MAVRASARGRGRASGSEWAPAHAHRHVRKAFKRREERIQFIFLAPRASPEGLPPPGPPRLAPPARRRR